MAAAVYFCEEGRQGDLQTLITDWNTNGRIVLIKNAITFDEEYVYSSSDIATYSGYANQTPVFPSATLDANDDGTVVAPTLTFNHNGGGTANTIYGWGLWHAGDSKMRQLSRFENGSGTPAPKSMAASGDIITVTPTLKMKQGT